MTFSRIRSPLFRLAPLALSLVVAAPVWAAITFQFTYNDATNGLNKGFYDPTIEPASGKSYGEIRRQATESAAQMMGSWFQHSVTVTVYVQSTAIVSNLGMCGSSPTGPTNQPGFFRSIMAKKIIEGIAEPSETGFDAELSMNFISTSDPNWDYSDTVNPEKTDFKDTLIHEITHALGFLNAVGPGGGGLIDGVAGDQPQKWYQWDRFLVDRQTNSLINAGTYAFNPAMLATLTNGLLCFYGSNALAGNNGQLVQVYGPEPWGGGSSACHVNTNYHEKTVMYWIGGAGKGGRYYSPAESGALMDLGYSMIDPVAPTNVTASQGAYPGKIVLSWQAPVSCVPLGDVTGYAVYRGLSSNRETAVLLGDNLSTLSYEDTAITAGTYYYYWVRAKYLNALVPQVTHLLQPARGYAGNAPATVSPLAADYDGDRKADPMLRAGTVWYAWPSGSSYAVTVIALSGGSPGAGTPVVADFDGDFKADPAAVDETYRWWVWLSSAGYAGRLVDSLTGATGVPGAGDVDGDRLADPALRSDAGLWTVWLSSAGYAPVNAVLGAGAATPFLVDVDGDGKADPTAFAAATWTVWMSGTGYMPIGPITLPDWPRADAQPVMGDFDADGKADLGAVVDTSWYVWLSSSGYVMVGPFTMSVP